MEITPRSSTITVKRMHCCSVVTNDATSDDFDWR